MKKKIVSFGFLALSMSVSAYDVQIDGIYYNITNNEKFGKYAEVAPGP